jgi:hypothetical protein
MILTLAVNAALSMIVFAAVIILIMRTIRSEESHAPAVITVAGRSADARPSRAREPRGAPLRPARPWA